ncbi:hypothetical protein KZ813_06095 [Sphingomonas sp. RHCKR7]|uniref:hypothetical protein n=1 Tax=Sphingomonas folli TaxID=2862497 RepID=UPI001CA5149B|nr:hypothetical protein [Sphingomonas folli]MBW6526406.1 hypothetical protein [Sphingomonas folli]
MSRIIPQPFLIAKGEDGSYRITVRDVRYNSQSYPIVTSTLQAEVFHSAHAARAHAKEHLGAKPGQFGSK